MIKVSVIIPVYNAEKYLRKCLNSIINQTFSNYEIILVNDGSTDGSYEIINEYSKRYGSKIKTIIQSNKGVSYSKNKGIEISKAQYITFVDSDDWVHPSFLSELYDCMEKRNACISKCDVSFVTKNGNSILEYKNLNVTSIDSLTAIQELFTILDERHFGYSSGKMYLREFLVSNNLRFKEEMSLSEDTLFFIEASIMCNEIYYIPKQLYFYNKMEVSTLSNGYIKDFESKLIFLHLRIKDILIKNNLMDKVSDFYVNYQLTTLKYILNQDIRYNKNNKVFGVRNKILNFLYETNLNIILKSYRRYNLIGLENKFICILLLTKSYSILAFLFLIYNQSRILFNNIRGI